MTRHKGRALELTGCSSSSFSAYCTPSEPPVADTDTQPSSVMSTFGSLESEISTVRKMRSSRSAHSTMGTLRGEATRQKRSTA